MMKRIGLIGGMSWESSLAYYRLLNTLIRERLGGLHSAKILMDSVDFAEIEQMQRDGRWAEAGAILADSAQRLMRGGADFLLLCTNTMHKVADQIQASVAIPLLHIAAPTGECIRAQGISKIGLLATGFTMEQDFYSGYLTKQYGLTVLVPERADRQVVHDVIYQELCSGQFLDTSRAVYLEIMGRLVSAGAEGIILGCTEIGLLIRPEDTPIPLFDTTLLHVTKAIEMVLGSPNRSRSA